MSPGGITGPVEIGVDLGEWLDIKNFDVLITFVLGILLGVYIHHRITKHAEKKKIPKTTMIKSDFSLFFILTETDVQAI